MNEKIAQHRRELLREMSLIERMEYGSLAEECREVRARLESGEKLAMDFLESSLRCVLLKDGAHLLEDLLNDPLYQGQEQEARPGEKRYRYQAKIVEHKYLSYVLRNLSLSGSLHRLWRCGGGMQNRRR